MADPVSNEKDPVTSPDETARPEVQSLDTVRLSHAEIAAQLRAVGVMNPEVESAEEPSSSGRSDEDPPIDD
jgi:hypothetical protein